eukprot:GHVR01051192.1.p1 GENE.GHVR01051192.1~~GHVR01051192.1.p1  ORF type:complete len:317 (-),score=64.37 GHVR01051192.1:287-1237(-)
MFIPKFIICVLGGCKIRKRKPNGLQSLGEIDAVDSDEFDNPYFVEETIMGRFFRMMKIGCTLGLLWMCAQLTYNLSLEATAVATSTVMASTSVFFTYAMQLLFLGDKFRIWILLAIVLSFGGVVLIALTRPIGSTATSTPTTTGGMLLGVGSAVCYAFFTITLKGMTVKDFNFDVGYFFGCVGLVGILVTPPLLFILHILKLEIFKLPDTATVFMLLVNGMIGAVLSDYLWSLSVLLLSPVIATVALSFSIPLSILTDAVILKQHKFAWEYSVGTGMVFVGVVVVSALSTHNPTPTLEPIQDSDDKVYLKKNYFFL